MYSYLNKIYIIMKPLLLEVVEISDLPSSFTFSLLYINYYYNKENWARLGIYSEQPNGSYHWRTKRIKIG